MDISEAVGNIAAEAKPIILLDTCGLLDIIRSISRRDIHSHTAISAQKIIDGDFDAHLVVYNYVVAEFNSHIENIKEEATHFLAEQKNKLTKIQEIGMTFGYTNCLVECFSDEQNILDKLKCIPQGIIDKGFILDSDHECHKRAEVRVSQGVSPASRGKTEIKDCIILENYLELIRQLRDKQYLEKIVFLTSNKSDFGTPYKPNEPIDQEFRTLDIELLADFSSAINYFKRK